MSVIGQIKEFDKTKESFESYVERLENYMIANGVKKEQKVAVILTAIGPETYGLLRNLITPDKPNTKEYEELVKTLREHLNPKPLIIAERFNFNNRIRRDDESVADFAAQLKKLTIHCEFGDFFDEALRDRFVAGLRKEAIQRKLLSERELNFNKALQIAQSMEMAERQSAELKDTGSYGSSMSAAVHQIHGKKVQPIQAKYEPNREQEKACFRCGSKDHPADSCKFKKYKCNSCGKLGHLAKVCRGKAQSIEVAPKGTHLLEAAVVEDDPFGMFAVRGKSAEAVTVPVVVAGRELVMEVETGAAVTVIPKDILGPKTAVPTLAAARLQRWALILSSYQYEIKFRSTDAHANADALSRLPVDQVVACQEGDIYHFSYVDDLPVTARDISCATRKDRVLSRVLQFVKNGWPVEVHDESLLPFFHRRLELSVEQDCVLWGLRVVIPEECRSTMLSCLHDSHPGICRMKALARSYLWWPKLDSAIEEMVRNCSACQSVRKEPVTAPLIPWKWPTRVWQRVHVDFAEFEGINYLIVVDAHSKWPEVFAMRSTTATKTIELLSGLFAAYGLPEEVVSDNGPQFTSAEFGTFMRTNGITHTRIPPYHPASNGGAERYVQTLKQALKTSQFDKAQTTQQRLSSFLFAYRNTPHTVTDQTPAEVFLKRKPRTRLSLLQPNLAQHVEEKQRVEKEQHDHGRTKTREFIPGDLVLVRNFRGKNKWNQGTVMLRIGPLAYQVKVGDRMCHVHVDHLLPGGEQTIHYPTGIPVEKEVTVPPMVAVESLPTYQGVSTRRGSACEAAPETVAGSQQRDPTTAKPSCATEASPERRYPKRHIKPPERLDL